MPEAGTIVVTGSSGLIGSAVSSFFHERGFRIHGVDNNQRAVFVGPDGDTRWNRRRLESSLTGFEHHEIDIRDRVALDELIAGIRPTAVVHCAAQPSHDRAAEIPFDDFETNAVGTLNLLEAARRHCPEAPFVFLSTNKVYGDRPNQIELVELETRWDFADPAYCNGISESFSIDQSTHSLYGASKAAADILVQEYGRYFGMPTCCLRAGCTTGPAHSGTEVHGFLSYLVRCNVSERLYRVFGYKGKQVRDNIDSEDIARFIYLFCENPRIGEVYNIGGGKQNSCSVLEAFEITAKISGQKQLFEHVSQNRKGDHICYFSDLAKARRHYPEWKIELNLGDIVAQLVDSWRSRLDGQ